MLWALRPLHSFALVAAVQHLMGLAMGVLIYLLARRYGLPAWVATLAAVPVLFDVYELQLESDAVPDVPFGLLVVIALYLLLRPPGERRPARTRRPPSCSASRRSSGRWGWRCWWSCWSRCSSGGQGWRPSPRRCWPARSRCGVRRLVRPARAPVQPDQERRRVPVVADDVVRGLRGDQAARRRAGAVPAAGSPRIAASLYIWDGDSPLLRMPGGRFSARTNALALNFALRAIAAQPGGYAAAVGHDAALSFYWNRPVHPDPGSWTGTSSPTRPRPGSRRACAPRAAGRWPATRPPTTAGGRRPPARSSRSPRGW